MIIQTFQIKPDANHALEMYWAQNKWTVWTLGLSNAIYYHSVNLCDSVVPVWTKVNEAFGRNLVHMTEGPRRGTFLSSMWYHGHTTPCRFLARCFQTPVYINRSEFDAAQALQLALIPHALPLAASKPIYSAEYTVKDLEPMWKEKTLRLKAWWKLKNWP